MDTLIYIPRKRQSKFLFQTHKLTDELVNVSIIIRTMDRREKLLLLSVHCIALALRSKQSEIAIDL